MSNMLWNALKGRLVTKSDESDLLICKVADVCSYQDPTNEGWSWQYQLHPLYDVMRTGITGKFVHHDLPEKLAALALELRDVIAQGLSPALKYRPTLSHPYGPFGHLLPPLCVYGTEAHKERLYKVLVRRGLRNIYWQSNEATRALHAGLQKK